MLSPLDNLVAIGQLDREPCEPAEIDGLLASGSARIIDAANASLSLEPLRSRVQRRLRILARGASVTRVPREDSLSLFQTLTHTIGLATIEWRILDDAHKKRNLVEYEGTTDIDETLVTAVIRVALIVEAAVRAGR